jgi:flagellar hook-associated protein 3 FlgL
MMRVTSQSLSTQVIDSLQQAYQRVAQAQEVITSRRRINHLSDDPIGATRTMVLRSYEESLSQYKRNIDNSLPFLDQADSALSRVTDGLNRAKEIALAMANDTNSPSDRQSAAVEVHQILLQILSEANTKVENRSIFGGYLNGTPAFAQGANGITYQGDNGKIAIQVNPTTSVNINLLGNEVFQGVGVAGGTGIFDALQDLEVVLRGGSSPNTMSLAVNLDASLPAGSGFSPTDAVGTEATPATFLGEADFSTNMTVFDSKGQAHDLTFLFAKTAGTTFKYRVVANSNDINGGTPGDLYQVGLEGTLAFNADGTLNSGSSNVTDITLAGLADGAPDISIAAANLSFAGSTQRTQSSSVLSQTQSTTNGIQAQIGRLDAALEQISSFRAEVGARLNSAQTASDAVTVMQDHTTAQRSKIEDADVLSAYSDFARLQNAFQAALQSASQVIQPTLLDFLK